MCYIIRWILCCIQTCRAGIVFLDDDDDEMSALGDEMLADNNDDMNDVGEEDNAPPFGAMDDGDKPDKDDVETGEYGSDEDVGTHCAPEDVIDDPDDTEHDIATEVLVAENFLRSFGGEDQIMAGNLKKSVLLNMTTKGWENVVEPLSRDTL